MFFTLFSPHPPLSFPPPSHLPFLRPVLSSVRPLSPGLRSGVGQPRLRSRRVDRRADLVLRLGTSFRPARARPPRYGGPGCPPQGPLPRCPTSSPLQFFLLYYRFNFFRSLLISLVYTHLLKLSLPRYRPRISSFLLASLLLIVSLPTSLPYPSILPSFFQSILIFFQSALLNFFGLLLIPLLIRF